jgi:ABC-type transport system involved in multi-copper enzyme maturation permease subunit
MLRLLILKDIREMLRSPKFIATFAICSILILLSIYIGINEYFAGMEQYRTATQLADQRASEATSWNALWYKAYRRPDPMMIFVSGLNYDIGRWSAITTDDLPRLRNSVYLEDPIFAIFRFIDFAFIVQVVLTLFALVFTYNAVNGEREQGTLRLVFANPVPRAKYLLGKIIGSWLALVIPLSIPVLLGVLMVVVWKVPFSTADWERIAVLIGLSLLLFTFFLVLGVLVSTFTRRTSVSFLLSLVIWLIVVLIIPRAGIVAAGQAVPVPTVAEIEGQKASYASDRWVKHWADQEKLWQERNAGLKPGEHIDDDTMWKYMQEDDASRKAVDADISAYEAKLYEDLRNRKAVQEHLGLNLARVSPAAAFELAAMNLAGSGIELKSRYEDAMQRYRTEFTDFVDKKSAEDGPGGMFTISIDTESGLKIGGSDDNGIDISELPRFAPPVQQLNKQLAAVIPDAGLLAIYSMFAFALAFLVFLRSDLR